VGDPRVAFGNRLEEALFLGALHGETLHRPQAREHLGPAAERARPVLEQRTVAARLLRRRAHADQRGQRRERAHRDGEAPIEFDERSEREAEIRDRGQHLEREFADRGDEAVDRRVDAIDGAAHRVPLVIGQRQLVQPRSDALAQREVQRQPHAPAVRLEHLRQPHLQQLRQRDER
jgi:hypothetical protein